MNNDAGIASQAHVTVLSGVGKSRAEAFERLGVTKICDLVTLYPRAYENRGNIVLLSNASGEGKEAFCLTIATAPVKTMIRKGMTLVKLRAYDESGTAVITYFNQDYMKDFFEVGQTYRFFGKAEIKGKTVSFSNPIAEKFDREKPLLPLVPIYPLVSGLTQKFVDQSVQKALLATAAQNDDILPPYIVSELGLCSLSFALRTIHRPPSYKSLSVAIRRLAFDEFFTFSLGTSVARGKNREAGAPICPENDISSLTALLPFPLTGAQLSAIEDIKKDMAKDISMRRIIVGDVGCGKTVCAIAAILIALQSGKQALLMAPTGILATQHYDNIKSLLGKLGFSCRLLTGATSASEKREIYGGLSACEKEKRIDLVVGTHALLNDKVKLAEAGLVITDEQHRFGVSQRTSLSEKGEGAHTLVMSATPIPRSLALTLYGDLDLSVIDEMPVGRQKVDTFVVNEGYRERLNAFIRKQINEGGQVYIVCPEVSDEEENEDEEGIVPLSEFGVLDKREEDAKISFFTNITDEKISVKTAVGCWKEIKEKFPDINVALVHGKMKASEKEKTMNAFVSGEAKILVSTTVIEVGVNVPSATLMIIENADRFGLAQLHQLRGRVGRGNKKSYCVLVSSSKSENALERLEIMKKFSNGFDIAEKDLQMRGPGDFLFGNATAGIRQSGALRLKIADICRDAELLSQATKEARILAKKDPELSLPEHKKLRFAVDKMFSSGKNDTN